MNNRLSIPLLRQLLLISTAVLIVFPWLPGATEFSANKISLQLLAPISMPILVMLLLLDATMLAVYREGSDNIEQTRFWGKIKHWNLAGDGLLKSGRVPFFVRLNS